MTPPSLVLQDVGPLSLKPSSLPSLLQLCGNSTSFSCSYITPRRKSWSQTVTMVTTRGKDAKKILTNLSVESKHLSGGYRGGTMVCGVLQTVVRHAMVKQHFARQCSRLRRLEERRQNFHCSETHTPGTAESSSPQQVSAQRACPGAPAGVRSTPKTYTSREPLGTCQEVLGTHSSTSTQGHL